jgi:hypothetical protein
MLTDPTKAINWLRPVHSGVVLSRRVDQKTIRNYTAPAYRRILGGDTAPVAASGDGRCMAP